MGKYNLTILLPGRLDAAFVDIFNALVTLIIWNPDEKRLDELIAKNDIDVTFEWQYGNDDHTILDYKLQITNYKLRIIFVTHINRKMIRKCFCDSPMNHKSSLCLLCVLCG